MVTFFTLAKVIVALLLGVNVHLLGPNDVLSNTSYYTRAFLHHIACFFLNHSYNAFQADRLFEKVLYVSAWHLLSEFLLHDFKGCSKSAINTGILNF